MVRSRFMGKFKIGDTYGAWVVGDNQVTFDEKSRAFILVKCTNCKTAHFRECGPLLKGNSTRCNRCNYSFNGRGGEKNPNYIKGNSSDPIKKAKCNAQLQNIPWKVSNDYLNTLYETQSSSCAISGDPIALSTNYVQVLDNRTTPNITLSDMSLHLPTTISYPAVLDRIDPNRPYEPGNVAWISARVNTFKGSKSQSEFIQMCFNVAKKYQHPNPGE